MALRVYTMEKRGGFLAGFHSARASPLGSVKTGVGGVRLLEGNGGEEQAKITWGWGEEAGHPFLFGWIHSGFRFLPIYWDNSWSMAHMALAVANQKSGGSRICFPTHLHMKSLESHFELM